MRRQIYILPARPWWEDAIAVVVGVLPLLAAMLVLLFFAGCGDDVECPPAPPAACVPASGAALNVCGYDIDRDGVTYPAAGCTGFLVNQGCTVTLGRVSFPSPLPIHSQTTHRKGR